LSGITQKRILPVSREHKGSTQQPARQFLISLGLCIYHPVVQAALSEALRGPAGGFRHHIGGGVRADCSRKAAALRARLRTLA
jgi:hypothetical protein